jgi:hypothetical protein
MKVHLCFLSILSFITTLLASVDYSALCVWLSSKIKLSCSVSVCKYHMYASDNCQMKLHCSWCYYTSYEVQLL